MIQAGSLALYGTRIVAVHQVLDGVAVVRALNSPRSFRAWARYLTPWKPQ